MAEEAYDGPDAADAELAPAECLPPGAKTPPPADAACTSWAVELR